MNCEISTIHTNVGNVYVHCHDSERLGFFGLPKNFNFYDGGYARVVFPEKLVLKDNSSLKLIAEDEGQLLANGSGNS